jgi:MinD superfamily P-loop ATPase
MILSIASGKGGTGKTTMALALSAHIASKRVPVCIFDCDVEEPNVNLFLKSDISILERVYIPIPYVHKNICDGCGKCGDICEFNAMVMVKGKPLLFPDMCHACGGCLHVCPINAITEVQKEIGTVEEGYSDSIRYVGGRMRVSEAISPPLIKAVKKHVSPADMNIIDAPPGTSCPVIESVKDSDYAMLVTEPTPFGLNDLELAVGMIREIGIPFGVVINRFDTGDNRVVDFCKAEAIEIIALIPDSREIAERYSKGEFIDYFIEQFSNELDGIIASAGLKLTKKGATT